MTNTGFKRLFISLSFMLLVTSCTQFSHYYGINNAIEGIAYFIIVIICLTTSKYNKNNLKIFLTVTFLLIFGILVQNLAIGLKLKLISTMLIWPIIILKSENFFSNYCDIRFAIAGVVFGLIISLFTALTFNFSLIDYNQTDFFNIGFNCGILYKNYFSGILITLFIATYICVINGNKSKIDMIFLLLLLLLNFFTSSKGGWIILILFLIFYNLKIKLKNRIPKILKVLALTGVCVVIFIILPKISSTYQYRYNGLYNYSQYVVNDKFALLFGKASIAYRNDDYVNNIRSYLYSMGYNGWNGTYELAVVNILIKNGLFGIGAYLIIFINYFRKNKDYRDFKSLLFVLIISTFVENYICNLHTLFGVFSFILLSSLINIHNSEKLFIKSGRKAYD